MAGIGGVPQNMQGFNFNQMGSSTMGSGGKFTSGDTQAVTGADGKLTAFDPNKNFSTFTPGVENQGPKGVAAGMTASGVPEYLSNWLASGGQGNVPTSSSTVTSTGEWSTPTGEVTGQVATPNFDMDKNWSNYISDKFIYSPDQKTNIRPAKYGGPAVIPPPYNGQPVVKAPASTAIPPGAPGSAPQSAAPPSAPPGQPGAAPPQQGQYTPQQLQTMMMEPWFRQRQWEQYGSPNANIGSNMAGTFNPAWGAGQWFTPGMPVPGWQY